jgi:hypothetical protein
LHPSALQFFKARLFGGLFFAPVTRIVQRMRLSNEAAPTYLKNGYPTPRAQSEANTVARKNATWPLLQTAARVRDMEIAEYMLELTHPIAEAQSRPLIFEPPIFFESANRLKIERSATGDVRGVRTNLRSTKKNV